MSLSYKIGSTQAGMKTLDALTTPVPAPRASYKPGNERKVLANGSERWLGWPEAVWTFPLLTDAQRDQLRAFCAGASATAYITTLTNASGSDFDDFSAVMVWPEDEDRRAGFVFDLTIRFQALAAV